jgi:hypothetical protein
MIYLQIALAVLTIVLVIAGTHFLERRIKRFRVKLDEQIATNQHRVDRTLWPQLEALTSLYRIIDGRESFPPMRSWAASPDIMLLLVRHIERNPVRTIVECGSGTSTIILERFTL